MTASTPRPTIDRRAFLLVATASVVAACGGSDGESDAAGDPLGASGDGSESGADDESEAGGDVETAEEGGDPFTVVQRFPTNVIVPGEIRLPVSLARAAELVTDGPGELDAQVVDLDGNPIGEPISAVRRDVTPAPYYAFRTTLDTPGFYRLLIEGGPADGAAFQIMERDQVVVPSPGEALPGFETPTVDDPAGVDPICTREPPCPFHELTLTDALESGRPVAYIVGTPAFCQTGTCTPALEAMIEVESDFADDVVFVHAEVWNDLTATEVAPAVQALNMQFEPALFLTDSEGTLVERLDGLWNAGELREQLDTVV